MAARSIRQTPAREQCFFSFKVSVCTSVPASKQRCGQWRERNPLWQGYFHLLSLVTLFIIGIFSREKTPMLNRMSGAFQMSLLLSLLLFTAMATATPGEAYRVCPQLANDSERLACFDRYSESLPGSGQQALEESLLIDMEQGLFGSGIDGLTNHEPNKLLARMDKNDISRLYMDANLSVKHPVLNPVVDVVSSLLDIDRSRNLPRLYLAFSTRFSQYLGSRNSSPVVARRYNPELFLRVWRDGGVGRIDPSYWDFGYGHESNGQQINSEALYREVESYYVGNGESRQFARDNISRGWDYVSVDWHKQWNAGFLPNLPGQTETLVEYRHYLEDGLFQGAPEEFNAWEAPGESAKTRDYFDGLRLSLSYVLNSEGCGFFCFEKVQVVHRTGYASPFTHNTTSLELTTNIAGLPIHLWGRAGYNSDLVDYYDYTNSWGLGIEFLR